MNPLKPLLLWFKDLSARKAVRKGAREEARRDAMMVRKLAQLVAQTQSSYEIQRYVAGRKAALKNRPPRLKRIPYGWRRANG